MKIKEKVLIMFDLPDEIALQRLKDEIEEVVLVPRLDLLKLLEEVRDAAVLYVAMPLAERSLIRSTTTQLIERGSKLKAIAVLRTIDDLVDTHAATTRRIPIIYSDFPETSTSEHAIALMICAAKKIQYLGQEFREGRFNYTMRLDAAGYELYGKTVGIVGLGDIGRLVAQKCRLGFSMNVIAYDPYVERKLAGELGIELMDKLSSLLAESDFVCLHAILTDETRHIIGAKALSQMKRSAYLINTTPGLVDEKALIEALQSGSIAGAALDVFDPDPPDDPDNPLFKLPNVTLTPHMAGVTRDNMRRIAQHNAESIIKFLRGETPSWMRQ